MKFVSINFLLLFGLVACNQNNAHKLEQGDWIKGTNAAQIKTIEKQFRGLDNAMVEIGYRYQELYWAGQDKNWEYADYQLKKISLALENGLERRPKRAKSAEYFQNYILPEMKKSLEKKDVQIFNNTFKVLTNSCNSCHEMEKVPFFNVQIPIEKQSPIKR